MYLVFFVILCSCVAIFSNKKNRGLDSSDFTFKRKMIKSMLEKTFIKEVPTVREYISSSHFRDFYIDNSHRKKMDKAYREVIFMDYGLYKKIIMENSGQLPDPEYVFTNICTSLILNKHSRDKKILPQYFKSNSYLYLHKHNVNMKDVTDEFEELLLRNYEAFKREFL